LGGVNICTPIQFRLVHGGGDIYAIDLTVKKGNWMAFYQKTSRNVELVSFLFCMQSDTQTQKSLFREKSLKFTSIYLDTKNMSAKGIARHDGITLYDDGLAASVVAFKPNYSILELTGWEHDGFIERLEFQVG
jgi:hypothetical protein